MEINLLDHYPKVRRPIDERGDRVTDEHRKIASRFGVEYFDGDRLTGYGGYHYHPRFWTKTVERIRDHYRLAEDASVLDIGCAKGFMMYDFKVLMPELNIQGIDISSYALEHSKEEIRPYVQLGNAKQLPFADNSFDLVIAINVLHSLSLEDCAQGLKEIQRVSRKHSFVVNDAWRSEAERNALMKWNLTGLTFMHVDDWKRFFQDVGYSGDYTWFIAESA